MHWDVRLHQVSSFVNHLKEVILKMKFGNIGRTCAALVLLTTVSLTAYAQGNGQGGAPGQPGGGGQGGRGQRGPGGRGAALVTLPVSVMNSYLKLTAEQKAKITAIQTQYKADSKSFMPAPGAQPDPQAMQEMRQKSRAASTKADADIKAALTEDQTKMLDTLNKDMQTFAMVGIPPEALGELKLTETQRTKITTISDDSRKEMQAKFQAAQQAGGGFDPQMMMDMRKAVHDKVMDVLDLSQKNKLEAYLKDHPQPQGGRGFGGGRRGGAGAGAPPGGAPPRN